MERKITILSIDDEENIRFALGELFHFQGWEACSAPNVKKGLEQFRLHKPDIVLIDYHMPGINGVEGVQMLRALSHTVPIIVFTIDESQEVADQFLQAGASDFALKPIKAPDIIKAAGLNGSYSTELQKALNIYRCLNKNTYGISISGGDNVLEENKESVKRKTGAENILLYGVPGAGKSHEIKTKYCDDEKYMERVVFHPDYTYSDFVGQILPRVEKDRDGNDKLKYVFTPGPYTKLLKKAQNDPGNYYYLVIEELNRGNAPAIFGEVFQLLDRKDEEDFPLEEVGESEYGISNYEVAKEVYGDEKHQVRIPSNMYVLATMNTADQNVFTLDTAFQRRWNMRQIENNFDKSEHSKDIIAGTKVSWGAFATVINDMVIDINVDMASSEDKRIGTYFARKKELEAGRFSEKVLKYLWDDAFKMDKTAIFNENCKSLEDVVITYETATSDKLAAVLRMSVYEKMLSKMQQKNTDNNEN